MALYRSVYSDGQHAHVIANTPSLNGNAQVPDQLRGHYGWKLFAPKNGNF